MAASAEGLLSPRVEALRRFNRFYTRRIGVLQEGLLDSPFSLAEARVLWELAHRRAPTAAEIAQHLGLDAGYLSRMLRGFEGKRLIRRRTSPADARRNVLSLTPQGRRAFATLDARSRRQVAGMLRALAPARQRRVLEAMQTIEASLGADVDRPRAAPAPPCVLRPPRPGDLGWVVHRHGVLYAREEGYDVRFEGLVAEIVGAFVRRFDPKRERCWIAERAGERVGCVFLVRKSQTVAKLRLLLVEPDARGTGLGGTLVAECVEFARRAGYRKLTLWTQGDLQAARHLYRKHGFRLVGRERHRSWGRDDLVSEFWERDL